jgi:DNA-binding response OmpR family regulator
MEKDNTMKVLICDAEPVLLAAIEFRLLKYGLEIIQTTLKETLQEIKTHQPELVIIDTEGNPKESLQLLKDIKADREDLPILIASPIEEEEELWGALRAGAEDFITKPFKPIELVIRVRRSLDRLDVKK